MIRRAPVFAVLSAVALVLIASLSLALAHPAPASLLTPTVVPIFDQAAKTICPPYGCFPLPADLTA